MRKEVNQTIKIDSFALYGMDQYNFQEQYQQVLVCARLDFMGAGSP